MCFLHHVHVLCVTPAAKAIAHSVLLHLSADLASATNTETKKVNIYLEGWIDTAVELFLTFNCLILNFSDSRRNCGSSDKMNLPWVLMAPMQQGHTSLTKVFGIKICHIPKSASFFTSDLQVTLVFHCHPHPSLPVLLSHDLHPLLL